MRTTGEVLAHGGGGPEALIVGIPVIILVVFVFLERRARARERAAQAETDEGSEGDKT